MAMYTFTIVLDRRPDDDEFAALYDAGCDDAAFGVEQGVPIAEFDREAATLADAIATAVRDLESAGFTALRVMEEDLVTLADIAERVGQSRESVRRYATGERGPGGFPPPVNPMRAGTTFYRWSEVAPWIQSHLGVTVPDADPVLAVANLVLQARQHRYQVPHIAVLTDLLTDIRMTA